MICRLLLSMLLATGVALAEPAQPDPQPPAQVLEKAFPGADRDLLGRVAGLLQPGQLERLNELNLRPAQVIRLMTLATELAPKLEGTGLPPGGGDGRGGLSGDVDDLVGTLRPRLAGILEPRQLQILESLEPSARQLLELSRLLQEPRGQPASREAALELPARWLRALQDQATPEQRRWLEAMREFLEQAGGR